MTNYSVQTVAEFIAASPPEAKAHLKEIRIAVTSVIPEAEEKIGYGKPYYKLQRWIVGYDVYKQHIGFEIWEGQLPSNIRQTLEDKGYKTGNKTFQIRYDQAVPIDIIKKLTRVQAQVAADRSKKK